MTVTSLDLGFRPAASLGRTGPTAVLVLAGGDGRRLGGGKPTRALGGKPLIDHALDKARRVGGPFALGVRYRGQIGLERAVTEVLDAPGLSGPLAALAAGLVWAKASGAAWLLLLPCDAPFLPDTLAQELRATAERAGVACCLPRSKDRPHPACALWRTDTRAALDAYAEGGGSSLVGLAQAVGFVPRDWGGADPDPFANINTAEDLANAEARLRAVGAGSFARRSVGRHRNVTAPRDGAI